MKKTKALKSGRHQYQIFTAGYIAKAIAVLCTRLPAKSLVKPVLIWTGLPVTQTGPLVINCIEPATWLSFTGRFPTLTNKEPWKQTIAWNTKRIGCSKNFNKPLR